MRHKALPGAAAARTLSFSLFLSLRSERRGEAEKVAACGRKQLRRRARFQQSLPRSFSACEFRCASENKCARVNAAPQKHTSIFRNIARHKRLGCYICTFFEYFLFVGQLLLPGFILGLPNLKRRELNCKSAGDYRPHSYAQLKVLTAQFVPADIYARCMHKTAVRGEREREEEKDLGDEKKS